MGTEFGADKVLLQDQARALAVHAQKYPKLPEAFQQSFFFFFPLATATAEVPGSGIEPKSHSSDNARSLTARPPGNSLAKHFERPGEGGLSQDTTIRLVGGEATGLLTLSSLGTRRSGGLSI